MNPAKVRRSRFTDHGARAVRVAIALPQWLVTTRIARPANIPVIEDRALGGNRAARGVFVLDNHRMYSYWSFGNAEAK